MYCTRSAEYEAGCPYLGGGGEGEGGGGLGDWGGGLGGCLPGGWGGRGDGGGGEGLHKEWRDLG